MSKSSKNKTKLNDVVDVVADFGADPTGVADSWSAIQTCLNTHPTATTYLPSGTFSISAPLDLPVGASLMGAGPGSTILKSGVSANPQALIRTYGFASLTGTGVLGGTFNADISNLTVDGNKANNTNATGILLYGKNFRIDNVRVQNCPGYGIYTEYAGGDDFSTPTKTLESVISRVIVEQCNASGMYLKGPHDMTIREIVCFSNGLWGIEVITSIHCTDVNTYLNTSGGIYVYNIYGAINYYGGIYGTEVVGSTATGIGCRLASGGNTLSSSLFGGPIALQIDANNNIVQGSVANSTTYGVLLNGASAQAMLDLVMYNNTGVIFGVSTASLKSMVRAYIGDSLGTLQNGAFPGTWSINGYTGFGGSNHQLHGGVSVIGGRLSPPTTNYASSVAGVFYDTIAPLSGNFQRGDRVFNSLPTVGSPKSWVCTVTGSPGTWVSEGNL